MAKKFDFDWKNFLLQKGEKIGLGVGAAVMAVMLVFGVKGAFSGSPSANAEALNAKTKVANDKLVNNKPKNQSEFEVPQTLMTTQANLDPIKADDVRAVASLFVPLAIEDTRLRAPKIEQPIEMVAYYANVQVRSYMWDSEGKKIMVLRGSDVKAQDQKSLRGAAERLGGKGMGGGMNQQMMVQPTAQRNTGQGQSRARQGLRDIGREQGMVGLAGQDDKSQKKERAYIGIEELPDQKDVRLADKVYPMRTVIVEGVFPLRQQLENMKSALHSPTLGDAFKQLNFAGFNVQRREVGPDGKPMGDFADFGFEDAIVRVVRATGKRFSEEDPKLKPLILPGLVYKLPLQFEERTYPSAFEQGKLKELNKTLETIEARGTSLETVKGTSQFDINSPSELFSDPSSSPSGSNAPEGVGKGVKGGGGAGGLRTAPATETPAAKGGGGAKGVKGGLATEDGSTSTATTSIGANWEPPEYCLVRFFDVLVDPGKTYEYRYQIKLHNPNLGKDKEVAYKELAENKFVISPWFELPQRVTIPADFHFFAVNVKELDPKNKKYASLPFPPSKDHVALQLQRWVDFYDPSSKPEPVGDWAVAEQVYVARGEFVGGKHKIEMPVWSWFNEEFVIATSTSTRNQRVAEMPFTEGDSQCPILVDFSGGKVSFQKPEERRASVEDNDVPRELLLLSPEGRLFVRNSVIDAADPQRKEHQEWWSQRVKEVKERKMTKKDMKAGEGKDASPFSKGAGGKQ